LNGATSAIVDVAVADARPIFPWDIKPAGERGGASAVPSNPNSRLGRKRSPLRQGRDQMAATAHEQKMFVGIDVSKSKLDVHIHPSGESYEFANAASGIEELVARLKQLDIAVIAVEATGGFEALAVAGLAASGLPVVAVNPKQVHNFAKALGLNAKTDRLDAHVIACFAEAVKPEIRPLANAETIALSELLARRRQIVQMITAEKNRAMRMATNKPLQRSIARILDALQAELATLDDDIDRMIKASPVWREKEELLSSVPGIGKVIARTLLAEMPELGEMTGKQAAALSGLAPWTRQSGQWRGKSMIGAGRSVPRSVLYIAAMIARRHNPTLRAFGLRLLQAGKPKKVVIIAIARKLVTILNAILRDKKPWQTA
jgi:transposase